ncbi:cytochrome c oxidase subunit II [Planococcus antarcticus DSM 14505]|uniref:Cytochrome c oxidase subunit 2 n=1 Tax=Planococcus antarcticus DSM 14505 TaxID=1185653 RepID=A0A1C7DGQ4_9BACL|nr:cytochrome c oxidase subunit II [Planococcus antarcticus]ANU10441.1 cytochrome c oxidase subunit II [Planococcus antarcticus DSM 14505]EIM07823.1 cytochrome c oxidase subunit II [Planococcus antarcticus DSM 14505]
MMKGIKKWRLFALMTALLVFLAGCGREEISTLIPAGEVAQDQFNLLILSSIVMLFVIIVVSIIFVLAIVKFRRSKMGEDMIPEQVEGSARLEFLWTAVPIVLLLILAVPTVYSTFDLADVSTMDVQEEDGTSSNLTVNVTGNLYWWEFEYPEQGIVTSQELVVPTDERVYFNLISADIKHSFWIPSIGGKLDVNPENVNTFYLTFDQESSELEDGVFYGKCAELCGASHALMDFKVKSVDREEFDQWVTAMQSEEPAAAEGDLAQQGEELFGADGLACIQCHAVSGAGGTGGVGPNLATFGDRNRVAGYLEHNEENLKNWIQNPQEYKPGNLMPEAASLNNGEALSDQELDALAAYLMGLSVEE